MSKQLITILLIQFLLAFYASAVMREFQSFPNGDAPWKEGDVSETCHTGMYSNKVFHVIPGAPVNFDEFTLNGLPAHSQLRVVIELFPFATWDKYEQGWVFLDDSKSPAFTIGGTWDNSKDSANYKSRCLVSSERDPSDLIRFEETFAHSASSLKVQIKTNLNEARENEALFVGAITVSYELRCPFGQFTDREAGQCVKVCPEGRFGDEKSSECVETCPAFFFADSLAHKCVKICPLNFFADPTTGACVQECPDQYFAESESTSCVQTCQPGNFRDLDHKKCVCDCPKTRYADSTT